MKNLNAAQQAALRLRAERLARALPPLRLESDGRLCEASREAVRLRAERILRANRAVGGALVLCLPGGADERFFFGHARLSPRIPVKESTCFRLASVSKLVMSFGALALCEDGALSLDADLSALFGYPLRNPRFPQHPVTLRMLLTHTSGITDQGNYGSRGMAPGCTLRELLDNPDNWRETPPGKRFEYSNLGAGAAGVAMELAAGKPLDDIMRERVFAPLAIRASYDPRRILPHDDLADGYAIRPLLPPRRKYDAAALSERPEAPFVPEEDYLCAAGRLITDAQGLSQLVRLLASHGEMGVLSAEGLALMRACQDGLGGIRHAGRGLNAAFLPNVFDSFSPVGHQGVAYGMCAELFADPERGAGVGVMTSGVRLDNRRTAPLMQAGFDLLALGFGAMAALHNSDTIL